MARSGIKFVCRSMFEREETKISLDATIDPEIWTTLSTINPPLPNNGNPIVREAFVMNPRKLRNPELVQSPLETYLREINETALLTAEEEKTLRTASALATRKHAIRWCAPIFDSSSISHAATPVRVWLCRI